MLPANVALTEATLPEGVFLNTVGSTRYELLTAKTGRWARWC